MLPIPHNGKLWWVRSALIHPCLKIIVRWFVLEHRIHSGNKLATDGSEIDPLVSHHPPDRAEIVGDSVAAASGTGVIDFVRFELFPLQRPGLGRFAFRGISLWREELCEDLGWLGGQFPV